MEKWDILNSKGEKTGKKAIRGKTILNFGEYHLVVHIWIQSDDGRFLIQRRSDSRKLMPGEWAATGGAAVSGEDSFAAACRELYEELGIKSTKETLKFVKRIKRRNSFVDIWKINTNVPAEELRLQKSEVAGVCWVTREHLAEMIKNGEFHDYGKYYWSVIFDTDEELLYELKG